MNFSIKYNVIEIRRSVLSKKQITVYHEKKFEIKWKCKLYDKNLLMINLKVPQTHKKITLVPLSFLRPNVS